ncbi:MAG TPA: ABC transporter permease [Bryobacteraceae bacterium]
MRFLWLSAVKDLLRLRREPVTLLTWIGVPSLIAILLVVIFGRGEARPHGTLLIADEDRGIGAILLASAFSQGPLGNMITVEKVNRVDGRRRMDKGGASALLVIPKGFTNALFESKPVSIELVRNPAQRILPDIIEEMVSMLADGAFYLQAVAGDQLRAISSSQGPTDAGVAEISVRFNRIAGNLQKYLNPPLIQVRNKVIVDKNDRPGAFAVMMLPGMLYMAVFFIAGGLATDVWRERTSGALRRVATTPASLGIFLAGKMLAAALVLAVVGAFGLTLAHLLVDLPVANFPLAALWIAASGCGLYLLMMILQSAASTERVANLLSNFVMLPLTMLGGSFFPLEIMPKGLASIGRLTPNGWSIQQLQGILSGALQPAAFPVVAVFLAAAWFVALWNIRRTA